MTNLPTIRDSLEARINPNQVTSILDGLVYALGLVSNTEKDPQEWINRLTRVTEKLKMLFTKHDKEQYTHYKPTGGYPAPVEHILWYLREVLANRNVLVDMRFLYSLVWTIEDTIRDLETIKGE